MNPEDFDLVDLLERAPAATPTSGTVDDDDDPNDERDDENEAPIGGANERTEAPEEFVKDDEDPSAPA
jgi:hypothetical protein